MRTVTLANVNVSVFVGSSTGSCGLADGIGTNALFLGPRQAIADNAGNLFVTDGGNDNIRIVTVATRNVKLIAGSMGVRGVNDGVGKQAMFWLPSMMSLRGDSMFVTDYNHGTVRRVALSNQCPAGSFCTAGATSIQTCPAGSFCPAGSTASAGAGLCSAGFYCSAGSSQATGNTVGACAMMRFDFLSI